MTESLLIYTYAILTVAGLLLLLSWLGVGRREDISWPTLDPSLTWDPQTKEQALLEVYKYVTSFSAATIKWYQLGRRPKRRWGMFLRIGALLLTAIAGLVPLAERLGLGKPDAVWGTVMLGAAGVFVSVDLLMGFTSGWVRYMLAQQKVERLNDVFLMEWNSLKDSGTPSDQMLERAKAFLHAVGKVIDDETQEWATDFQNALREMEKARKAEAERERVGAIQITVKSHKVVQEWILEVEGSQRGRTSGKNLAVTDVPVGIRKLRAHGVDSQGKVFSDEATVKVEGGVAVTKELELS